MVLCLETCVDGSLRICIINYMAKSRVTCKKYNEVLSLEGNRLKIVMFIYKITYNNLPNVSAIFTREFSRNNVKL